MSVLSPVNRDIFWIFDRCSIGVGLNISSNGCLWLCVWAFWWLITRVCHLFCNAMIWLFNFILTLSSAIFFVYML